MRHSTPDPDAPERREDRDRGYTMTEMLVATVLMGTIVLAIVGGMWAVVRASRQNDERAKVQAVLGGAADGITSYLHVYCPEADAAYLPYAQQAAQAVGWNAAAVQIVKYQYWNPDAQTWDDTNSLQLPDGECSNLAGFTSNKTLQKVTIEVTSPTGQYRSTIDIVKSDVRAEGVKDVS